MIRDPRLSKAASSNSAVGRTPSPHSEEAFLNLRMFPAGWQGAQSTGAQSSAERSRAPASKGRVSQSSSARCFRHRGLSKLSDLVMEL